MILEYDIYLFSSHITFENNKKKTILLEFTVYVYTIVLDKNRIMNIICTLI